MTIWQQTAPVSPEFFFPDLLAEVKIYLPLGCSNKMAYCIASHHHRTNSSWLRWLPQMSWNQLVNIDEPYVIWYDLIFFPTYVSSLTIL